MSKSQPSPETHHFPLGATLFADGRCAFVVWAPHAEKVEVHLISPVDVLHPMTKMEKGYHVALLDDVEQGTRYTFRLDGKKDLPDPASRYQPNGVHAESEVTDPIFDWQDANWFGLPLRDYIIYELHVGTFTQEGTFEAIIPHLPELKKLGITAIELMPVAQFPGSRNWGYDGVGLYAVQNSYGGPTGLKKLVNACHVHGLAVVLDVVYNHLGPEGNYLRSFGPYFSEEYRTFWGPALNFDGPDSDEVRRFFLENALQWQRDFHIDALRLDAVHAIHDASAIPFLQELATITHRESGQINRRFHLIGESDLNNPRIILPEIAGGFGLDGQWSDDFHHGLHVLLTGEQNGYYGDFYGVGSLAKFFREGYTYTGEYSQNRRRRHGTHAPLNSAKQFVVFAQNHDQIGNRMFGDRLTHLVSYEDLKLAAASVILSPFIPLLFMGEEYGERARFQYFISHTDASLVEAVRRGRREEFASFGWKGDIPDPQSERTFQACKLNHALRSQESHQVLYEFHRELIRIRKSTQAILQADKTNLAVDHSESHCVLQIRYNAHQEEVCLVLCFSREPTTFRLELPEGRWTKILDSAVQKWNGKGSLIPEELHVRNESIICNLSPKSCLVLQKKSER